MRALLASGLPLFVAALTLAGCGGGSEATSERKTTPTEATTGTAPSTDPADCMEEAGIANVEEEAEVWSGTDLSDGAVVTVERKASPAEAKQAEREAEFVWTATADRKSVV